MHVSTDSVWDGAGKQLHEFSPARPQVTDHVSQTVLVSGQWVSGQLASSGGQGIQLVSSRLSSHAHLLQIHLRQRNT